ncbi:MFS transporter [Mechercharimyces sp. CAU 1602]|uniref:MFS transporter n=1 Tax=Mechercharimyces sp. CAU 1602 TaxID=2973933 RepID=UPI002162314B|nr:MFS transporter [Mechercharimyces sp. CAU 1602]MCS1350183.1 MFS transporter [Mechercharimyces sp. CAU 1602]
MSRWRRNLYILMACQFLVFGAMTMIIPFLPLYLSELGVDDPVQAQLWSGVIFGVNFLTAFIFAPIWGTLADRYGRKIMVLRSGFGMSIVILLMGFATSPLHLFFLRLLNGTVSGFIPASISLVATNTPSKQTGYALGMLQAGGVSGSIMGPFMGGLLAEWIGFRMIFFITSICIGLAALVVWLMVKEEVKPEPQTAKVSFFKEGSLILHHKPLLLLFSVAFIIQFAMMSPMPQMPLFVKELGAPGGYIAFFTGLVTAVAGFANMLTSPRLGKMADRYGADKVLFITMIGAALVHIPHALVSSVWTLLIARFLLGMCLGGLLPSLHALIRHHSPVGKESTAFGYSTSAISLGNMLGPMLGGVFAGFMGIRYLFLLTALFLVLGSWWLRYGLSKSERRKEGYRQEQVHSA